MSDTESYGPYDPATLPPAIVAYMAAERDGTRSEVVATVFTSDARVTDEGVDYDGEDGIRAWVEKTVGEYTYTTTLQGQRQDGPDQWTVLAHLKGDFPGGTVDLPFRFTLRGERISKLIIAP